MLDSKVLLEGLLEGFERHLIGNIGMIKQKPLRTLILSGFPDGGKGSRTPDLMNAIHARSQLRYTPGKADIQPFI